MYVMLDPFAVEPDIDQSPDMAEALSRAIVGGVAMPN
jgi:hypothetical protein